MENKDNLNEDILQKIKAGKIKMKPKIFFVLKTGFFILLFLALLLFTVYLVSFIIFSLRASGLLFLPKFGILGFKILFGPLPWLLIFLSIGLFFLLEIFAKHFSFVYRRPILYSLFTIIVVVVFAGLIIGNTPFHPALFRNAQDGQLPIIGPFYRNHGAPIIRNVYHGIVFEVIDNGYIIETPNNDRLNLIVSSNIFNRENIKEGSTIVAIGEKKGNTVQVSAIRRVNENDNIFPIRPRFKMQPFK